MDIWFSADWHLGHRDIVLGVSSWADTSPCRNFKTLQEHNETIIENINTYCKRGDRISMIGDFSLGGKDNVEKFRRKINCNNIEIAMGNHDIHIRKNYNNCQSLFTNCKDILTRRIGKNSFVMCHYAMRTWAGASNGSIMLHGHNHGSLPPYRSLIIRNGKFIGYQPLFKTMDVGIDTHPEFRPYHIDEIKDIMAQRISLSNYDREY